MFNFLDKIFKKPVVQTPTKQYQSTTENNSKPKDFISTLSSNLSNIGIPKPKEVAPLKPSFSAEQNKKIAQDVMNAPAELGRLIISRPIRMAVQSFQDIGGRLGDKNYQPEEYVAKTPVEKALFGEKPIKSAGLQYKDIQQEKESLIEGGVNKNLVNALGIFAAVAPMGDVLAGGGEKKKAAEVLFKGVFDDLIKQGTKLDNVEEAFNLLKKSGIEDDIAKVKAPLLSATKTSEETTKLLRDTAAEQLQKVSNDAITKVENLKAKQKAGQYLDADELEELNFLSKNKNKPEVIIASRKLAQEPVETVAKVADEVIQDNSLISEAKKYNSAEEFVKAQGTHVYRGEGGSNVAQGKALLAEGKHFASDSKYPQGFGKVSENIIKPSAKVLDLGDSTFTEISQKLGIPERKYISPKELSTIAKEKGYDVIKYSGEYKSTGKQFTHFVDLTGDSTITKSQLTDIWKKAQDTNIKQVQETEALKKAAGTIERERGYITSAKASDSIASDIAREISENYNPKTNDILVKNSTERVANNFDEAKKFARENSSDEAVATRVAVDKQLSHAYRTAKDPEEKEKLAQELTESLREHSRLATEEGRAVQANRLLGKTTPEGILRETQKMIDSFNKTAKKKLPDITQKDVEYVMKKTDEIEDMADGVKKEVAKKELADHLESLIPSSWWKKIIQVWKAGLLTGIKTSGINISSTFFNGLSEKIKDIPATGVDLATSLITGKRTKVFTLKGELSGNKEGLKKGWEYLRHGITEMDDPSKLEYGKVNYENWGKVGKVLEKYTESVYRTIGSEDFPFFYGAFRRSLNEQALVKIKNEGLQFANKAEKNKWIDDFVSNPSKDAFAMADADAKIATFKNDTALGRAAVSIRNASPLAEVILPFAKTPSAVASAIFNYTPAGQIVDIFKMVKRGEFDQKKFAESLGRGITGSAALWLGYNLYKDDKITLGYPQGEKERAEWEATGKIPNAIKLGGKYYPLTSFGPQGSLLAVGGYLQKGYDESGSITGAVTQGMFGGLKQLTEQSFLTGVKDVIDAINDPEKGGAKYTSRLIGSIVPTVISDGANSIDEYQRKQVGILGGLKSRIPIVREKTLMPKLDVFGNKIERNRTAIGTMFSPIRLSNETPSELTNEIERLGELGEDVQPTKVDSTINNVKLNDKEYFFYQRFNGELTQKALSNLINNPEYQKMDAVEQAKLWKNVISQIRNATRDMTLPMLLIKRYDLPTETNPQLISELVSELSKNERFSKATPEKQSILIKKILKVE